MIVRLQAQVNGQTREASVLDLVRLALQYGTAGHHLILLLTDCILWDGLRYITVQKFMHDPTTFLAALGCDQAKTDSKMMMLIKAESLRGVH